MLSIENGPDNRLRRYIGTDLVGHSLSTYREGDDSFSSSLSRSIIRQRSYKSVGRLDPSPSSHVMIVPSELTSNGTLHAELEVNDRSK